MPVAVRSAKKWIGRSRHNDGLEAVVTAPGLQFESAPTKADIAAYQQLQAFDNWHDGWNRARGNFDFTIRASHQSRNSNTTTYHDQTAFVLTAESPSAAYEAVMAGRYDTEPVPEFHPTAQLEEHIRIVEELGIRGTPHYWIGGEHVAGADLDAIRNLLP